MDTGDKASAWVTEARARADAASKGGWQACGKDRGVCLCGQVWTADTDELVLTCHRSIPDTCDWSVEQQAANARFVSLARYDVPALCDEIEKLTAEITRANEQLTRIRAENVEECARACEAFLVREQGIDGHDLTVVRAQNAIVETIADYLRTRR